MEESVERIRERLSDFCVAKCKAKCCNKGFVVLKSLEEMEDFGAIGTFEKGYFTVDVSKGCPNLSGSLCSIYTKRPSICRSFPLFLRGKTLFVAEWCDGIAEGYVEEELKSLSKKGIKVYLQ